MDKCIFCDIINNKASASIVYKDNLCIVFMDIRPFNKGHLLVVPNKHAEYLADLDPETGGYMFKIAQKLSKAIRESGIKCEGIDLFLADGEAAGQEIFHTHLHILPRYEGDGFGLKFGRDYIKPPTRSELDEIAKDIESHIK